MDKFAIMLGEHAGDLVESAVKKALGVEDKDDDDDKKGGFFSIFGDKDKDKEKEKERERDRRKDDDDDKGGFISKFFNKDKDKDDDKEKQFGFHGLFNEKGGADGGDWGQPAAGGQGGFSGGQEGFSGGQGGFGGGQGGFGGGPKGQSKGLNDGDLLDDLMDVAEETAKGK